MVIKPIEKGVDKAMFLKIGALVFLVGLGFTFNKMSSVKKNNQDLPQVLSVESKKISLEENAQNLIKNVGDQSKNLAGQILGETTDLASQIASKSANTISNFIIDKATDPIVEQIKKLPQSQQEEIKKNICN